MKMACHDQRPTFPPSHPPTLPPAGKAFAHVVVRLGFHMAASTQAQASSTSISNIVKELESSGETITPIKRGVSTGSFKRMSSVGDMKRINSSMSITTVVE